MVAIAPLESHGVGQSEVGAITDNLASRLQQTGKFRVMERSQMNQILGEQSFQQSGTCDGSQCAVEMGKVLGIDHLVVGSIGLVGTTYTFNLRLVDVGTGEALRSSARNRKGTIDEILTDLVPSAVADLADLPQPVQPTAAAADSVPPPQAESKHKRGVWPWIVGGALVVGGGATAAVLLTQGSSGSSNPTTAPEHFKITW